MTDGGYNPNGILNPVHEARKTMTEPLCICGHGQEYHTGMSGEDRFCKRLVETVADPRWSSYCQCPNYRPVLDWPDSPGLWWCDRRGAVQSSQVGDGIQIDLGSGEKWPICRAEYEYLYGTTRFVRVLETNPFGR